MNTISVDDRILVARLLQRILSDLDPKGTHMIAVSGKKALELAGALPFDVAFLDVDMPGMNGLELARRLQEIWPRINIIFVTGYEEYSLKAFELYASGYLLKPIQEKDVAKALAHLRYPVARNQPRGESETLPGASEAEPRRNAEDIKNLRTFGERLQSLRVSKNLSQKQLADLVFVDRSSIAHWEGNRRIPSVVMINRFAQIFDMSVTELMEGICFDEKNQES